MRCETPPNFPNSVHEGFLVKTDILIENSTLFDPGIGLNAPGRLAIRKGIIADHNAPPESEAKFALNAAGCLTMPGFIDAHLHCNWLGNYIGLPADLACIPSGVTAAIDAGSSGVSNYRGLLRTLDGCLTRTKIMLHVSAGGQMMSTQFPENTDPSVWNMDLFEQAFAHCGERIVGLKIRAGREVLGDMGLRPIREAAKLAERFGTRLFVHATNPPAPMAELAALLRPGDVMCHMYHGTGHTIIRDGRVDPGIIEARKRGVVFDVSQGKFNFSLAVARIAIAEGFLPDSISTDLGMENWNNPLDFSLALCMSKHLALGMTLDDVVRCVTANAAMQFGRAGDLGTLATGTAADVTVAKLVDHAVTFQDIHGNVLRGDRMLLPLATVIGGQLLYRSPYTL